MGLKGQVNEKIKLMLIDQIDKLTEEAKDLVYFSKDNRKILKNMRKKYIYKDIEKQELNDDIEKLKKIKGLK